MRFAGSGYINRSAAQRWFVQDRWLALIWAGLVMLGPAVLWVYAAGLPRLYLHMMTVCPSVCEDGRLSEAAASAWVRAGMSMQAYASLLTGLAVGLALICFLVAALLILRRPRDRMAVFTALMLILLGGTYSEVDELVGQAAPWLGVVTEVINQLGFGLFPILPLTLPDGRFVPGWSRWLALLILLVSLSSLSFFTNSMPDLVFMLLLLLWGLSGPIALVYRYRTVASPIQRQQLKWAVAGISLSLTVFIAVVITGFFLGFPLNDDPFAQVVLEIALFGAISIVPLSIGISVLRYRLWDIDLVVRRTLQYSLLTGLLALVYFGGVVLLQGLLGPLTGNGGSPLVTVLTTLGVAALFNPLRRRVKALIDRGFYRRKYDAEQVMTGFATVARDEVDLDALAAALLGTVEEAFRPRQIEIRLQAWPAEPPKWKKP